jgi:hypothetical protein
MGITKKNSYSAPMGITITPFFLRLGIPIINSFCFIRVQAQQEKPLRAYEGQEEGAEDTQAT